MGIPQAAQAADMPKPDVRDEETPMPLLDGIERPSQIVGMDDAALAQLEVYRIQLEGQKVVSEINVQRVQAFNAAEGERGKLDNFRVRHGAGFPCGADHAAPPRYRDRRQPRGSPRQH